MNMKTAAVLLILINILWNAFMQMLDARSLKNRNPDSVADVYEPEEYRKWRNYKSDKKRIGIFGSVVSFAADIALILFNCYAGFAGLFPDNVYIQLFSVVLLTTAVSLILGLPFSLYDTFVTEEKYGFNRTTKKTFITDKVKEVFLLLILEGGLISLFALIHQAAGDWFIPALTGAFVGISLIMALLSPALTRIFNKFVPLEDGELKTRLTEMLTSHGYKVRAVEVMDASRRSTKMNAYFSGLGPTKRIVLYDTLKDAMTDDQICAVFAHEMGHGIHHDIIRTRLFSVANILLMACAAWLVVRDPSAFSDFGFSGINYGFAFLLLSWLLSIFEPALQLFGNWVSRRAEYRADASAADEGYGEALISGLKLLAKKDMADLAPDPLLVKLTYSHPTLAQRIEAIEKKTGKGS